MISILSKEQTEKEKCTLRLSSPQHLFCLLFIMLSFIQVTCSHQGSAALHLVGTVLKFKIKRKITSKDFRESETTKEEER